MMGLIVPFCQPFTLCCCSQFPQLYCCIEENKPSLSLSLSLSLWSQSLIWAAGLFFEKYTEIHNTRCLRKNVVELLAITTSAVNRFWKVFHCWKQQQIIYDYWWSGAERGAGGGRGAGSGSYWNRLERGAAFSPLTLRSRALLATNRHAKSDDVIRRRQTRH